MESHLIEREPDPKPVMDNSGDAAPWTIQQTFPGIILTLIPWIVLSLVITSLNGSSTSSPRPLPPRADLSGAIVTIVFSAIIEGAFLIAPLYFANATFRSITPHGRLVLEALGFRRFDVGRTLFWVVLLMLVIFGVNTLYSYLISVFHLNLQTNDQLILKQSKVAPLTTYATLFAAVVIAPFCEEVFFRGFVLPGFLRGISIAWALFLIFLPFAVSPSEPGSFALLFFLSFALSILSLP